MSDRKLTLEISAVVVDDDTMIIFCTGPSYSRTLTIRLSKYQLESAMNIGDGDTTTVRCRELEMIIKHILFLPLLSPHCEAPVITSMTETTTKHILSFLCVSDIGHYRSPHLPQEYISFPSTS